jgi:hypothetical protein
VGTRLRRSFGPHLPSPTRALAPPFGDKHFPAVQSLNQRRWGFRHSLPLLWFLVTLVGCALARAAILSRARRFASILTREYRGGMASVPTQVCDQRRRQATRNPAESGQQARDGFGGVRGTP